MEERIENAYNDPARLVKLKRRQLNESPLDSKSRKSYMEKFLETASPEHKAVYETSDIPPPLRLTLDNTSESGTEIHEISTVSPVRNSSQGKEFGSSPAGQGIILRPSMEELNEEVINREIVKVYEPKANFTEEIPPPLHKLAIEKEITVVGEGRKECSTDGNHSDDMTSEVENYVDALATMESEMDADNESRPKNDIGFINIGNYPTDSDANEEKLEVQAFSSDSQSVGISSPSDEGNSSFKKGRSSFSYSDTIDNLAEDTLSDSELAAKMFPSNKIGVSEIVEATPIQLPACLGSSSDRVLPPKDTFFDATRLPDLGEASSSSCLEDLNSSHILFDQASGMADSLLDLEHHEMPSDVKTNSDLSDGGGGKCVADSSEKQEVTLVALSAESHAVDELDSGETNVSSDSLPQLSNILQVPSEKRSCDDEVHNSDFVGEICAENSVNQMAGLLNSKEDLLPSSISAEVERSSGTILSAEALDVVNPVNLSLDINDATLEAGLDSECGTSMVDNSETCGFIEQQSSDILHDNPQLEADSSDIGASYSKQKQNVDEVFDAAKEVEIRDMWSATAVEGDAIPCDRPCQGADNLDLKDHVGLDDLATDNVHAESIPVSTHACGSVEVGDTTFQSSDLICSASGNLINSEESLSGDGDLCQEGMESNEVISQGQRCLIELETLEETNQGGCAPTGIDCTSCKSVSYNNSNLEDDIHYSSLAEPTKNNLNSIDLATAPASSEFSDQESESKYLSHLIESRAEMVSSPTCYRSENGSSLEQSLDIHTSQHDAGSPHLVEDSSNSLNLLSSHIQSLDHMDQENYLQTSFEHSKEGFSSQPSLEFSQQSVEQYKPESYPSGLMDSAFGLLPEATKTSGEVMPPLPPLPPMQWRVGRVQHVSSASQRELVEHGQMSLPMIPQYGTDENAQFGEQPRNLFLPLMDREESSGHASDQLATDTQPSPFYMHLTTLDSSDNSQYNYTCLDGSHSNPFLTLPTISNESHDYGSIAMEGDSIGSSDTLTATDTSSGQIPVSLPEKTTHPSNELVLDTSIEGGAFQHTKHDSEGECGHPNDMHVPPSTKREEQIPNNVADDLPSKVEDQFTTKLEEQPQHGLAASGETAQIPDAIVQHGLAAPEGETAQITNTTLQHDLSTSEGEANMFALLPIAEDGNSNGNPTVKLPRPRNPLIDAVAAHDKSKVIYGLAFQFFSVCLFFL